MNPKSDEDAQVAYAVQLAESGVNHLLDEGYHAKHIARGFAMVAIATILDRYGVDDTGRFLSILCQSFRAMIHPRKDTAIH